MLVLQEFDNNYTLVAAILLKYTLIFLRVLKGSDEPLAAVKCVGSTSWHPHFNFCVKLYLRLRYTWKDTDIFARLLLYFCLSCKNLTIKPFYFTCYAWYGCFLFYSSLNMSLKGVKWLLFISWSFKMNYVCCSSRKVSFGENSAIRILQLCASMKLCTQIKVVTSCSTHKIDQQETDG